MSKQDIIREGIDDILWELAEGEITILETKQKLSDLGVVIKRDRELPTRRYYDRFMTGAGQWNKEGKETGYKDAQQDMFKADYVAVESLI